MRGVWYDGRVSRPREAEVSVDGETLVVKADEAVTRWPLAAVSAEEAGDRVRVSGPPGTDGRLVMGRGDWRSVAGVHVHPIRRRRSRGELKLVGILTAVGVTGAVLVFFGIPAAAGPLAGMTPVSFEAQIGANLEDQIGLLLKDCEGDRAGRAALAGLGEALEAQSDSALDVRVRAVDAPIVNAFALPGGAVLITGALIESADTPDELAGVLAHEVAHVEQRHVMQAVWRALGAGLLLDLFLGGGTGAGQQAVVLAGSFTDLNFSRELEADADRRGIELLHSAGYDSRGLGAFFRKLADERSGEGARAIAEFLGSHPDTLRRARRAAAAARPGRPALDAAQWRAVKALCPAGR